jgi:hypothetical protein
MGKPRLGLHTATRLVVVALAAGTAALTLSLGLAVSAAPSPPAIGHVSAPAGATPVRITPDHMACGVGMTGLEFVQEAPRLTCVHTAADSPPSHPLNPKVAGIRPVCHGDGVNGPRIQFLYVYVEGQPNRIAQVSPDILDRWIPAMEGAFRTTSKQQGRELGMRVHMPDCRIDIGVVKMDAEEGQLDDIGAMYMRIARAIARAGYDRPNRKYHVWFDGGTLRACGIAKADLGPVAGDNPTPANLNNLGSIPGGGTREVAVTWKFRAPSRPGERPLFCWGIGRMGALVETHELLHLLGSVLNNSPNSDGRSHCLDMNDIMCFDGNNRVQRCASPVELLDCGSDDYFAINPTPTSFLGRNWNTANSRFLGDALEDDLPVYPPPP